MSSKQKMTPERIAELRAMPYLDYLKTQEWMNKRVAAILRADKRCQLCNSAKDIQVHHRTYERLGHEKLSDLIVLCRLCHALFHERRTLVKEVS